jgi:hypothetical protein
MLAGRYASYRIRRSAVDEIFYSLLPALLIQALALVLITTLFAQSVDFSLLYRLITTAKEVDLSKLDDQVVDFALYNLVLFPIAFGAGYATRTAIVAYDLDVLLPILRLNSEWYYLLTGRGQPILKENDVSSDQIYIQLDVLTQAASGEALLYCGILDRFSLTKDGGLDRVVLTKVYRRPFRLDRPEEASPSKDRDERYYNMPGVYFIIPFEQIVNLNVYYKAVLEEERTEA